MADAAEALSLALERVVARFADRVRRVGARYRLSGDDVDELFQQVRIRLWRARGDGDAIAAAPASYVYRTAVTAALDLIRRRQGKREVPLDPGSEADPGQRFAAGPPADAAVAESELAALVVRALDQIAATRRPVVRMYLAGYSPDEIGQALGWDRVKTRNLLYRGLADLRERLQAMGIRGSEGPWRE
jgi:RNA polymerase sigma-70 factor (ECF subfamily)